MGEGGRAVVEKKTDVMSKFPVPPLWAVLMQTGPQTLLIGRVSQVILFIFRALLSLGLLLNRSQLLSHQRRPSIMRWPMLSRKRSGFALFLKCWNFLFLVRSLFLVTIKLPALFHIRQHIDIWHHFIRDHVLTGSFSTTWIPTEDMPADIFTKSLPLFFQCT